MKKKVIIWISFLIVFSTCLPAAVFCAEHKRSTAYETGMYYTIQKGDTLWDLSNTFFDSPWYWPDLWEENSQIANPHWIYPGEKIRLFRKDGMTEYSSPSYHSEMQPETPASSDAAPRSLQSTDPMPKDVYFYPKIDQVGFIRKTPAQPSGRLFKIEGSKTLIGEGDLVYIRDLSDGKLTLGMQFFTYQLQLPLKNKSEAKKYGVQHYLTGVVEITETNHRFIVARVVKSFRTMSVGNYLMPYQRRSPHITIMPSDEEMEGKIIISEEHQMVIGDDTTAFIDKGKRDGISTGNRFKLYKQRRAFKKRIKDAIKLPVYEYGELLVLHTEPHTSTVLITSATEDIHSGARFHTP